ncbi:MAG TPA: glycosyltransferase [Candidatus Brocadiia bacterium]|nr:glycosyltransferase [Candidatus Brocadiia bacterium]
MAESKPEVCFITKTTLERAPHIVMPAWFLGTNGLKVRVLCYKRGRSPLGDEKEGDLEWIETHPDGKLRPGLMGKILDHLRFARAIRRERRRNPGQVFHINDMGACAVAIMGLWPLKRLKIVYHTHESLEPGLRPIIERLEKFICKRSDLVVTNGPNRARILGCFHRLADIPLSVRVSLPSDWPMPPRDPEMRRKLEEKLTPKNPFIIVYQGWIADERCNLEMIKALEKLPERYCMVAIGGNPQERYYQECVRYVKEHGLEGRALLIERMDHRDLLKHTIVADAGIMLYRNIYIGHFYCAPNKVGEYSACGLPMIVPNYPGMENLILKYKLGAVCDPDDPESIAQAMREIGESPENPEERHQRIRQAFLDNLAYEYDGRKLVAKVKEVAAG